MASEESLSLNQWLYLKWIWIVCGYSHISLHHTKQNLVTIPLLPLHHTSKSQYSPIHYLLCLNTHFVHLHRSVKKINDEKNQIRTIITLFSTNQINQLFCHAYKLLIRFQFSTIKDMSKSLLVLTEISITTFQ